MKQLFIVIISFAFLSCKKQNDWLDAKRQISDVVPKTLGDFQALLDNTLLMNSNYPTIGLVGCDNFYFPDESIVSVNSITKNAYFWNKDIFGNQNSTDYSNAYKVISVANIVLEDLQKLGASEDAKEVNNVRGQALFFRSITFYELASSFCKPYHSVTASTDLGICIRLKSDIYHIEPRSSVQRTYSQIISDLKLAATLLPVTPLYKTRPSKPAAFALLARTYFLMEDYVNAKEFADSSLHYSNDLLDFNSEKVSLSKSYRFPAFNEKNEEIIFYATGVANASFVPSDALNASFIDSLLYGSYSDNDLRKRYYYELYEPQKAKFRGTYAGIDRSFSGIANNEIYFIRAECNVRLGNHEVGIADLNRVLIKRYVSGKYDNYTTNSAEAALRKILEERRKEFPFTGQIRWQDLRRLNRDPRFARVLYRNSLGNVYQLNPNDPKYVYPLPQIEVDQAGVEQNVR